MEDPRAGARLLPRVADQGPPDWAADPDGLLVSGPSSVKVAITGGLASGKSTVATLFEVFGASRLDFDQFARQALAPGGAGHGEAAAILGPKAVLPDGQLDRALIGRRIFRDPALRLALEAIVHPLTWGLMLSRLRELGPRPMVAIEVPLLYEARLDPLFDRVILSFASPETQLGRLVLRNPSLGRRQARRMLRAQMPILEKLRRASMVIDNNGPLTVAIRQAKELWDALVPSRG
ncbi:MAG: dephospho-CoA kinase [Deltaproteobacteria bacterium]|jgi:dephospho-CoA kinase|nr:dephospho-CoA kinase [Deltaproteobacteria bacterium]